MKKKLLTPGYFFIFIILCYNTSAQAPSVLLMDANRLAALKKKIQEQDAASLQLVTTLQKQADELLTMKPVSVTDKAFTPVSGDKHDYMSQAAAVYKEPTYTAFARQLDDEVNDVVIDMLYKQH
jgi:hypothetical protein